MEKSIVEVQNQFMDVKDNCLIDQERIKHAQEQDPVVSHIIDLVQTKKDQLDPTSSVGYEYILMIVDHFTRFMQACRTQNKSVKTAATHFYDDFINHFVLPA